MCFWRVFALVFWKGYNWGPSVLANRFPQLVLGRLSGYGYHGELAKRAGHDINYLALSGVLHAIGTSTQPTIPLNLIGDFGGGAMHLLLGVMAKLIQRSITGIGGVAQTSILAGTLGLTPMIYGLLAADQWSSDAPTESTGWWRPILSTLCHQRQAICGCWCTRIKVFYPTT